MQRPSIYNGNTLETITKYVEEHFNRLEKIVQAVEDQKTTEHFTRMRGNVTLDGTGAGQVTFTVPNGYDWSMERVTVTSTGNGMCQVYLNTVSPQETVEIIGSSQIYSDAFNNNIFVPQGSTVIFNFTNAGASGTATVNLQVKLIKHESHPAHNLKEYAE